MKYAMNSGVNGEGRAGRRARPDTAAATNPGDIHRDNTPRFTNPVKPVHGCLRPLIPSTYPHATNAIERRPAGGTALHKGLSPPTKPTPSHQPRTRHHLEDTSTHRNPPQPTQTVTQPEPRPSAPGVQQRGIRSVLATRTRDSY